ncbi:MAG: chorismate mutase [Candidatus Bathyarchaeota archaeon]|nr:chorismate mutase [Candidatus Bathyarchaeota archaeon]
MQEIQQLRKSIDEVDEQILLLLSKRMEICRLIGAVKRKHGLPVKDLPRENDVYARVRKKAEELGLDVAWVERVYQQIVNMCISIQE